MAEGWARLSTAAKNLSLPKSFSALSSTSRGVLAGACTTRIALSVTSPMTWVSATGISGGQSSRTMIEVVEARACTAFVMRLGAEQRDAVAQALMRPVGMIETPRQPVG